MSYTLYWCANKGWQKPLLFVSLTLNLRVKAEGNYKENRFSRCEGKCQYCLLCLPISNNLSESVRVFENSCIQTSAREPNWNKKPKMYLHLFLQKKHQWKQLPIATSLLVCSGRVGERIKREVTAFQQVLVCNSYRWYRIYKWDKENVILWLISVFSFLHDIRIPPHYFWQIL